MTFKFVTLNFIIFSLKTKKPQLIALW